MQATKIFTFHKNLRTQRYIIFSPFLPLYTSNIVMSLQILAFKLNCELYNDILRSCVIYFCTLNVCQTNDRMSGSREYLFSKLCWPLLGHKDSTE